MPRIKIVLVNSGSYGEYDDYSSDIIRAGISDWEYVSDDDYAFLKNNLWRGFQEERKKGMEPMIIMEDTVPVFQRIDDIKKFIKDEQKHLADAVAAQEAGKEKKRLARLEAKAKREAITLQEKKDLFDRLKAELEPNA